MTSVDDFRSFGFEASVEFIRLEAVCERTHRLHGASGNLHFFSRGTPMTDNVSFSLLLLI